MNHRLAGWRLTRPTLQDLPHDHLVDGPAIHAGALQRFPNDN
jgi:hypothetical protein